MKKNEMLEIIKNDENVTITKSGDLKINRANIENLEWNFSEYENVKFVTNENTLTVKSGSVHIDLTIVGKVPKTPTGGNGHKSRNTGYIIILKNNDDKKPQTIRNIENCTQIKQWIKTLNRKNVEYLRIYDSMENACRKSAWIEH